MKELFIPRHHIPAKITKVYFKEGDSVTRDSVLLEYSIHKNEQELAWFDIVSPVDGTITKITAKPFCMESESHPIIFIKEHCNHPVQLSGLCAICGRDISK